MSDQQKAISGERPLMQTYRAILSPRSAMRSPWQADTLFGHLCWLVRYQHGEPALLDLLARYRAGEPPLLFSDGFPGDWLPRPLLPRRPLPPGTKSDTIAAMRAAKREKDIRWVTPGEFDDLRHGRPATLGQRPAIATGRTELKNTINRLTGGTTPVDDSAGGNLYNLEELAFAERDGGQRRPLDVSVYVRASDGAWAERARAWLRDLARGGYGARKSAGYGQFTLRSFEPFGAFDSAPEGANGFIGLSNWVPAAADPTDGYYDTLVKYGKLGEELANSANPFKFPLILLAAGSCFRAGAPIRPWYGRLVDGIAPLSSARAEPQVAHYGFTLAVPALLEDDASAD